MKYCSKCGHELVDEAVVCPNCGCAVESAPKNVSSTLRTIAFVFMILSCVSFGLVGFIYLMSGACVACVGGSIGGAAGNIEGINTSVATGVLGVITVVLGVLLLVPLAWAVPMTIKLNHARKENLPLSITFKICTLLFVNLISGILLLCDNN